MLSKTSCFNKTVYKKDLIRFAPAWGVYLLCLLLGVAIMYVDDSSAKSFWFAHRMGELIPVMSVVNLLYAPLVAMLLFGDLYNGRMCNAMHAMPLKREGWFLSHLAAGMTFSVVPSAIMALISMPLLGRTCVHNGWLLGPIWFVATNLEFLCFFGIALFCVFCAGNRVAMAAWYTAINAGAYVIYWLISCFYTPLLYGVVTPQRWAILLTPVVQMVNEGEYIGMPSYNDLLVTFRDREWEMVADFWVQEKYYDLFIWGAVGIVFMVLALVLYQKRHLECAGDAVAFRALEPVFQVGCALGGLALGALGTEILYGYMGGNDVMTFVLVACGMAVGWFAGRMFLSRNIKVFALRNWAGLGILAAVIGASLGLTAVDVLGIETWTPDPEKVKYAKLGVGDYWSIELYEKADIGEMIRLQELALEDRLESAGQFPEEAVIHTDKGDVIDWDRVNGVYALDSQALREIPYRYADTVFITYFMEDGREVQRRYAIWADAEEGEIYKEYMSRWEVVSKLSNYQDGTYIDLKDVLTIQVDGEKLPQEKVNRQTAEELMMAIKADCLERNMVQDESYHDGHFARMDEEYGEMMIRRSLYIYLRTEENGVSFDVFPDSRHTLKWMEDNGMLNWLVNEENVFPG